jgi:2'-5' RNA ligase
VVKEELFFLGLPIEGDSADSIRAFQREIKELCGAERQLSIPLHITIMPPFRANREFLLSLEDLLFKELTGIGPIEMEMNGFGHFGKKVLFVEIRKNKRLSQFQRLVSELMSEKLGYTDTYDYLEFHPHITLANRDFDAEDFDTVWPHFSVRSFKSTIEIDSLILYGHVVKTWERHTIFTLL